MGGHNVQVVTTYRWSLYAGGYNFSLHTATMYLQLK